MRLVDDVADEGDDLAAKQRGLADWRAALDDAVTGQSQSWLTVQPRLSPPRPSGATEVLPALVDTMQRYKMPARYLHDLISGAEMDLTLRTYPTFDRLREYCYRVAGTVGLTCTHVFGFHDPRALDLAEKLGLAFQLTNIIRDVHEDFTLWAASISPKKTSPATESLPRILARAKPLSASANSCDSKQTVLGNVTKKAPRFSA